MPIQLTVCRLCTGSRPDVLDALARLTAAYPDDLLVFELDCMAACDDVPAVMLETDYFPRLSPGGLDGLIRERLGALGLAAD